jgi:protein-L-isoaspartate O-methyltransferase
MYRSLTYIPPLVKRAMKLAEQMNYKTTCSVETGRLLQLLASQLQSGVIGEIGTGCGVAAAWIVSALSPGTSFFTVEADPVMAAAARALFDPLLNVRVVHGDWREFIANWRFALMYANPRVEGISSPQLLLQSLRGSGMIVLDGLTPRHLIPLELQNEPDSVREFWLNDPRLLATELMVSTEEAVILATLTE